MSGMYGRLTAKLGDDDQNKPAGLSPLDIVDLPEGQRQVMFSLLRSTSSESGETTLDMLQEKLPEIANLPEILADLTKNGWLIKLGELPKVHYRVNLRRKRAGRLAANVWASLTDRLSQDSDEEKNRHESKADDQDTDQSRPGFPALTDW